MVAVALIRRRGEGGAAGYAARLAAGLRARGLEVEERDAGFSHLFWREERVVVALERVWGAHVYRAGGGVHAAFRRAVGRRGPSARARWDAAVARSAGVVIANSRFVADQLLEVGVPSCRVEVVRTGVNPSWAPGPRSAGDVLFAAHGWRRKGASVAARAFAAARRPGERLLVAGRDSRRALRLARLRRWVPDLVDLGPAPDLRAVLPRVSAVLHPTLYDPASNLVLEAMACGVPAVTSAMDGSSEVVPSPALIVGDPRDVAEVARALRFALDEGRSIGSALRAVAEAWPDARNADAVADIAGRFG